MKSGFLAIRIAKENRAWGYTRIQGALGNLGHIVGRTTIVKILKKQGIEPAPERNKKTSWQEFLRAHWQVIAAADFFAVEVRTLRGLRRYLVFFAIELSTRRIRIAGIPPQPNAAWMAQMARNLTDAVDGFLLGKRLLLHDRDPLYTTEFAHILQTTGVKSLKLPARSPNLNAYAERFVRTIKESCMDRLIFFGEASLRHAVREFVTHYHLERNHQGIGNRLIDPAGQVSKSDSVHCRERLGGMLKFYSRAA